ncbi:lipoprotein signal peptidase, partial [gut metagenome]
MNKIFTKGRVALLMIVVLLVIDQVIKIAVKTHMYWHQSENAIGWLYEKLGIEATPPTWFYIFFTENSGMAFGMEIFDKLFLTLFRIVAVSVIGWFLYRIVKLNMKTGFIVCMSMILAGALGNIVDSVFYGVLFDESTHSQVATFLPEGGGYAPWFYGKVVDMF